MKKVLWGALGAVVAAAVGVVLFGWWTFGRVERAEGPFRRGDVQAVPTGSVQAFVVPTRDGGVLLVDTGVKPDAAALIAALRAQGRDASSVRAILLTHGHGDHLAAVDAFPGVPVVAHADEVALIEGQRESPVPAQKVIPHRRFTARVTKAVQDGEGLTLGGTAVKVFHLPGHTPGSVAYLIEGILFVGDSASAGKDGRILAASWFFSEDTARNRSALRRLGEKLGAEEVSAIAFSHTAALEGEDLPQRLAAAGAE